MINISLLWEEWGSISRREREGGQNFGCRPLSGRKCFDICAHISGRQLARLFSLAAVFAAVRMRMNRMARDVARSRQFKRQFKRLT